MVSPMPAPEQIADADGALDRAADQAARLGDAEMQGTVHRVGELHVGGDRKEHVAGFDGDLVLVKILVLQQLDMVERGFDQRLGTGLGIFLEQVLLQAAGIDADADRTAIGLGGIDHFFHPLLGADVAGIDAQACGAGIGGFQRALVSGNGCPR